MRLLAKFLFLAIFPGVLFPILAYAQNLKSEESFLAAVEGELEDEAYQTELPRDPDEGEGFSNFKIPEWIGQILKAGVWIALFLLAAVVIFSLAKDSGKLGRQKPLEGDPEKPVRPAEQKRQDFQAFDLKHAEAAAQKGNFTEAIHLLLLIALDRIYGMINTRVPKAKTSREILADPHVFEVFGHDLGILVKAAETALFAKKQPDKKQYLTCRRTLERLVKEKVGAK